MYADTSSVAFFLIIIIGKDIISHSYQSALCPSD